MICNRVHPKFGIFFLQKVGFYISIKVFLRTYFYQQIFGSWYPKILYFTLYSLGFIHPVYIVLMLLTKKFTKEIEILLVMQFHKFNFHQKRSQIQTFVIVDICKINCKQLINSGKNNMTTHQKVASNNYLDDALLQYCTALIYTSNI